MNTSNTFTPTNINLSIQTERFKENQRLDQPKKLKINARQSILLYLRYISQVISYNDFSLLFSVKYPIYIHHINILLKEKIIRVKRVGKPTTYKLNIEPDKLQVFQYATNEEHESVYNYLKTPSRELEDKVNIILNSKALKLLHELRNSKSRTFHFPKKTKPLNHLIKYNAVKELDTKSYTLKENHNQEKYYLEQQKLLKDKQIIFSQDSNPIDNLSWIVQNTHWFDTHNVHNLGIDIKLSGSYNDISTHPSYKHIYIDDELSPQQTYRNGQLPPIHVQIDSSTFVTVIIQRNDTICITVGCSQNPILVSETRRLNMILAEVFHQLNKISPIARQLGYDYYECDYDNFIIAKHDFAIDGYIPYKLPKGFEIPFTNQNGEDLILYVKKSYKNHSWIRIEDRADKKKKTSYTLPSFRSMIQNRILNLIPRHER